MAPCDCGHRTGFVPAAAAAAAVVVAAAAAAVAPAAVFVGVAGAAAGGTVSVHPTRQGYLRRNVHGR